MSGERREDPVEAMYGAAGKAAGETVLREGLDERRRIRPANDAYLLSRIARACVEAAFAALVREGQKVEVYVCPECGWLAPGARRPCFNRSGHGDAGIMDRPLVVKRTALLLPSSVEGP